MSCFPAACLADGFEQARASSDPFEYCYDDGDSGISEGLLDQLHFGDIDRVSAAHLVSDADATGTCPLQAIDLAESTGVRYHCNRARK